MPTPLRRDDRPAAVAVRALAPVVAVAAAVLALPAGAHEPGADAVPEQPGWQVGTAAALVMPWADGRWPTARWPGTLVLGSATRDQRDRLRLEHATLDVAARLDARFGAQLAIGWHDRDAAHLEAAALTGRFAWGGGEVDTTLGRDTVRMGAAIDGAGHFDRFSQPPLAKRAVLNDQWIDDGLRVAWRHADGDGLRGVEAGLWRGRGFPGGASGPVVPSLHLHAGWGPIDLHLTAARFKPEGRGAAVSSAGSTGHVHGSLDCRDGLQQRVCFDGTADVLGGSARWSSANGAWTLSAAGLMRHERGSLYSVSGDASIRTRIQGAWADAAWQAAPRWTVATRLERLVASNRLEGIGTSLLAREGGLKGGGPVERITGAVLYDVNGQLRLALEAGSERFAGGEVSHVALRAVWRHPALLGGAW